MFTGIIKKVAKVSAVKKSDSLFVSIEKPRGWKISPSESIAIDGVCSTVKKIDVKTFEVEYMPETLKKTTVGNLKKGALVNLERSLLATDFLDGHIVQGHVDTQGSVKEIKKVKQSKVIKIQLPKKFMKYVAEKGSISVNGVSLTVVATGMNWFSVSLVSYTLDNTNLGNLKVGDAVNIETDVLAKYLDKLLTSNQYAKKK